VSVRGFVGYVAGAARFVGRAGIAPLLLLTAACLAVGEQYPFSDFPMYSSFGQSTYYVHIADASDRPLATRATLGVSTPKLKKIFDTTVGREAKRLGIGRSKMTPEQVAAVGERVLADLRSSADPRTEEAAPPSPLRLYEVRLRLEHGRFERTTKLLAELR
jgi:hypothetical protein